MKSEREILEDSSRPQHHSTWIPRERDWRYATGVYQHDDFRDDARARSIWDKMDFDYQNKSDRASERGSLRRTASGGSVRDSSAAMWTPDTPSTMRSSTIDSPSTEPSASKITPRSARSWATLITYRSIDAVDDRGEVQYETTSVIVRIRLTSSEGDESLQKIQR